MAAQNEPGYDTTFIDRMFSDNMAASVNAFEKGISAVTQCAQSVDNLIGGTDSRRNMGYPQMYQSNGMMMNGMAPVNPQPVQYGYGYETSGGFNGFNNFFGDAQPGSMMNVVEADGFWNPAYGMGVY